MNILASNYLPLKTSHSTFEQKFTTLIKESEEVDIAIGYISEKSLDELANHIYKRGKPFCNLVIGMHHFEKFTRAQYAIAKETEKFLTENSLGTVRLVTSFPYHGKLYSFRYQDGKSKSILGSSNLNNILPHKPVRQYELDLLIDDEKTNADLKEFISSLISISPELKNLEITNFKTENNLMLGLAGVKKIEDKRILTEIIENLVTDKSIEIPIKAWETTPLSNINACFGKGRENSSTKIIRQRPWYEVELIVSKKITDLDWYPKAGYHSTESIITVLTDDGYEFRCKISGTNSKNFRSVGDLKILGKWLKGRLENAGVLNVNEPVTNETLQKYGRNNILMTPTKQENVWFLDFKPING
jgi:hypothetical protein